MPITYELDRDRENDSGIYYVYYREGGRQKRKTMRTKDRAEAEKARARFVLSHDVKAAAVEGIEHTVGSLWPIYVKERLSKGRSGDNYQYRWEAFMAVYFGHLTVTQATKKSVIREYVRKRTEGELVSAKTGKAVKESSVRAELVMLRSCLNFCAEFENDDEETLIEKSAIKNFELPAKGKPRQRALDWDEIDRLYAAARARRRGKKLSRLEIFLYLAIGTAGREEAIYDLTWSRVDLINRSINLDDGERLDGDKGRAAVYIGDDLLVVLLQAKRESDQSVPESKRLVMINKSSVWASMQRAVYDAGLAPADYELPKRGGMPKKTGISPHVLRHTAATLMVIGGVPLAHVAEFLGNTLAVVEGVYSHLLPKHLEGAAKLLTRGVHAVKKEDAA
jgi:integrase